MAAHNDTTSKVCNTCGIRRPASEFNLSRENVDGLRGRCKPCNRHAAKRIRAEKAARRWSLDTSRFNGELYPTTRLLDERGYDWSWAYTIFWPIRDYPSYLAGSDGTIWSNFRSGWQRLKPNTFIHYHSVGLCGTGGKRRRLIHQLVLETFRGPRPAGKFGLHFDDDPSNNRLRNLYWGTRADNVADAIQNGRMCRGSAIHNAKLTEADVLTIRELARGPIRYEELARRFGVRKHTIWAIVNRKQWTHIEGERPPFDRRAFLRGLGSSSSKLTEADVLEIKALIRAAKSDAEIGRAFGVSSSNISLIRRNKTWRHVDEVCR